MNLSINRNSWHYRLASYGHLSQYDDRTDLCRYFWALVRGALKAPAIVAVLAALLWALVVAPTLCLLVWAATGVLYWSDSAGIGTFLWAWAAGTFLMFAIQEKRTSLPGARLVAAGYRGWKEKTCVLVELK